MNSNKRINLLVDLMKLVLVILVACVLVPVIVLVISDDPWTAISNFFLGPFISSRRVGNIIEAAPSFVFTALAAITIFGSGQFSIVVERSPFIGITGVMIVATACKLSGGIHPAATILFGGFCGALVALVPVSLKVKWDMSELVTSTIFNYVVQFFAIYIMSYHFREANGSGLASLEFEKTSKLPVVLDRTRIHVGTVLGIVFCALVWFFLYCISLGAKLRIAGDNPLFAKCAGPKVADLMVTIQVIAGAIAGMGDGAGLLGMYSRFKWTTTPGYGWTGIVIALLARSNPLLVPLMAAFIGYLNAGAGIMARSSDVGRRVADTIQGVMMFLITADTLLKGWRQHLIIKAIKAEEKEAVWA